jgi:hypothetical protein
MPGKSVLALKFAWWAKGAFDAVVFQYCGQRPAQETAVELAARIGLDAKERPPEPLIAIMSLAGLHLKHNIQRWTDVKGR